ncbi:uncharacterized protein LOC144583561 [Pogona vitticeps]
MHVSSRGLPSSQRGPGVPVHRRLVSGLQVQTSCPARQSIRPSCSTQSRTHSQLKKVASYSISGHKLHRSKARCEERAHLSSSRKTSKDTQGNKEISPRDNRVSKTRPTSARPHGVNNTRVGPCPTKTQIPSGLAPVTVQSGDRSSTQETSSHSGACLTARVVDLPSTPENRETLSAASTHCTGDHRCEPSGLGCALWPPQDSCVVEFRGAVASHQSFGGPCHPQSTQDILAPSTGSWCSDSHGQHHGHVLCEQTRRNTFEVPAVTCGDAMGMVLQTPCFSSGCAYCNGGQHDSRRIESPRGADTRVATRRQRILVPVSPLGHPGHRCVCYHSQQEVSSLCIQSRTGSRVLQGCFHDKVDHGSSLPVPAVSVSSEDLTQDPVRRSGSHPCSTLLAPTAMVPQVDVDVPRGCPTPSSSPTFDTGCGQDTSPGLRNPTPNCVEDIPQIREVIVMSKKPSTAKLYSYKWKGFLKFAASRGLVASPVSLSTLLLFLRYLFDFNLSVSTLKVYIAAIVSFQPPGSSASRLFSHPTVKNFLKGVVNLRPPTKLPVPQWSLQLVLHALMRPPFEPMATCDLKLLSLKSLFLVAITSARRAGELAALRVDQPYLQFFKEKVVLHTDVSFLPKVVSQFHLNQPLILPTLFPNPSDDTERMFHMLDVRRALAFYVSRTKQFRLSNRLFLCYFGSKKGLPASPSTLSRWLVSTISLAYQLTHRTPPDGLRAHSTRAVASSTALLRGIDVPDICRTATWSNVSTFVAHYRLDLRARKETSFGRAVLTSVLQ